MIIYLKSKEDLSKFKNAGAIASNILAYLLSQATEGKTTKFLDNLAIQECEKAGVKPAFLGYGGFPGAICASINNALVHGVPDDRELQKGDLLTIDIGVDLNGYIGDTAETIVIGEEDEGNDLVMAGREALWEAIELARPGNNLIDICYVIHDTAKKYGYSVPQNYGGHGIDVGKLHGPPFIGCVPDEQCDLTLREGMVLALEPMLIIGSDKTDVLADNWTVVTKNLSTHCEHTVFITSSSPIVLTGRL